jgi:hypothetical protein
MAALETAGIYRQPFHGLDATVSGAGMDVQGIGWAAPTGATWRDEQRYARPFNTEAQESDALTRAMARLDRLNAERKVMGLPALTLDGTVETAPGTARASSVDVYQLARDVVSNARASLTFAELRELAEV